MKIKKEKFIQTFLEGLAIVSVPILVLIGFIWIAYVLK